ncbi:hypothetical protein [Pelosinus fermentans]|uniref:Uncharacterized protein n=1 Tax=Pelosinus fermentans JBW45 TaxID=1192197 RepID=I8TRV8_9FIRM|nr:hypothetical protein [Pelosinus fermentans]AJQ25663.1 hypothetical protein JBW_00311 [Pelosinus fermentans JBW45]
MQNEVTYLTFFDIQHTQQFFDMVNRCAAPVIFYLPNGQAKDLRFNLLVQNFLTWMDLSGNIPELKLECNNSQDVKAMIQFMMESDMMKTDLSLRTKRRIY